MINTSTPFQSFGESYYENHGVNFGFSIPGGRGPGSRIVGYDAAGNLTPNIHFTQGGFNSATPTFGGFNPNAGANLGIGYRNSNGGGFNLGLSLNKGSSRQITTTTPSLTTMNGFGGTMFTGAQRPFVTSFVPIVGHGGAPVIRNYAPINSGYPDNAITRAVSSGQLNSIQLPPEERQPVETQYGNRDSSARYGDSSVQAIKAERQRKLAAHQRAIQAILDEAASLESQQEFTKARIKYREALGKAKDESVKNQIRALIKASRTKG